MTVYKNKLKIILLLIKLSIMPLFLSNEYLISYSHYLYLFLVLLGYWACYHKNSLSHFVTPNALIFFYFTINFLLGSWGYSKEYILVSKNLEIFNKWQNRNYSTCLSMICPSIFLIADILKQKKYELISRKSNWINPNGIFLFGIIFLLPFFFIPLNLNFLGGQGDLSILPKGIAAVAIILYLSRHKKFKRYLGYGFLILLFATFSSNEKREAIFLIFPIIWLEANRYGLKPTIYTIVSIILVIILVSVLILSMSIVRGYGNFGEVNSIFSGMLYLPQYITSDIFISAFLVNIEATYLYFHSMNSIEIVLSDPTKLACGSTLIKPIFLLIPRDIFPYKPESILELYTAAHDPVGRKQGVSWTIGLFSDFIWNFHVIGVVLVIILAKCLCVFNISLLRISNSTNPVKSIMYHFAFLHLFTWVRGSGLDLYILYLIFGLISIFPIYLIYKFYKIDIKNNI